MPCHGERVASGTRGNSFICDFSVQSGGFMSGCLDRIRVGIRGPSVGYHQDLKKSGNRYETPHYDILEVRNPEANEYLKYAASAPPIFQSKSWQTLRN
jgi:hypothetical protein